MEVLGVAEVPLWWLLSICCLTLLYMYLTWTFNTFKKMGLPYERPLPLFGSLLAYRPGESTLLLSLPVPELQMLMLEKHPGMTHGTFQGRTPILETSDVEVIKQVMIKNFSQFTNRRNVLDHVDETITKYNLFAIQGDHWKHVRNSVNPVFSSKKLKQMYTAVNICADRLVAHLTSSGGDPINIKEFSLHSSLPASPCFIGPKSPAYVLAGPKFAVIFSWNITSKRLTELTNYMAGYSIDVIARTAFGLDIDSQSSSEHPFIRHGKTFFQLPKEDGRLNDFLAKTVFFMIALVPNFVLGILYKLFKVSVFDEESMVYLADVANRELNRELSEPSSQDNFVSTCASKLVDPKVLSTSQIRKDLGRIWTPEGLVREDIIAQTAIFLAAAFETTATNLQMLLYSMAIHPEVQEKLYTEIRKKTSEVDEELSYEDINDLPYLDWCVRESLRMYPPVLVVDRVASEDIMVNGVEYPKGLIVNFLIYAVHHNPDYWPDPETFQPERFSPENRTPEQQYTWLPFGLGSRNCVGMRLALLEVKVAVYKMIKEFRFEKTELTPDSNRLKFETLTRFLQLHEPMELHAIPRTSN